MSIKRVVRSRYQRQPVVASNPAIPIGENVNRQCAELLQRLHQTVPFPANIMEVTLGLLPPNTAAIIDSSPQARNMRLSMMWGDVVHVAIEPEDDWKRMLDGEIPFTQVFWMQTPVQVPVPDLMAHPYRLFEAHPHYDALCEWYAKANALNVEIEAELEVIGRVMKYIDHPALLRKVWPELMNFVKLQGPTVMHVPDEVVRNRHDEVWGVYRHARLRSKIIEHLTAATLLDAGSQINAWVAFKMI